MAESNNDSSLLSESVVSKEQKELLPFTYHAPTPLESDMAIAQGRYAYNESLLTELMDNRRPIVERISYYA